MSVERGLGLVIPETAPHRDESGRWVFDHAVRIPPEVTARTWEERNEEMDAHFKRTDAQVIISATGTRDASLYCFLNKEPLGEYPVASTLDYIFADNEREFLINDANSRAQSVYIVASVVCPPDLLRVIGVTDHYKRTLNAQCITLVAPFLRSTRQDKNIDKGGQYVSKTLNIRAELSALSGAGVDRIVMLEPHSSATQALAAQLERPITLLSLSPWRLMIDHLRERVKINPENSVMVRPDIGRNSAALRIQGYLGIPGVSFDKTRLSEAQVELEPLPDEEQELVRGRLCLVYDDEVSTMGTIYALAEALQRYGASSMIVCVAHGKFTPGWEIRIQHPLIRTVFCTDSREPVGEIAGCEKIKIISLASLLHQIIAADIAGVNFYQDPQWQGMIL